MSKAKARKDRTSATLNIKNASVAKSSHGKYSTVADLERKRIETTERNKKNRKGKKDED